MRTARPLELSVVLPCYNEAANLPLILEGYAKAAPAGLGWELVLVDNGSTDRSGKVLETLCKRRRYAFARAVKVAVNRGYGHGILCGLNLARGKFLAYSHADMQCAPADVFKAWTLLKAQPLPEKTLLKGRRRGRRLGPGLVTGVMSALATLVHGSLFRDINAQPKVFHRGLLPRLQNTGQGFEFDFFVLLQARRSGFGQAELPVRFEPRAFGYSKWATGSLSRWKTFLKVGACIFKLRFSR